MFQKIKRKTIKLRWQRGKEGIQPLHTSNLSIDSLNKN